MSMNTFDIKLDKQFNYTKDRNRGYTLSKKTY